MNPQPFEIRPDAEGVLWLSGELDLECADQLSKAATAYMDGQRAIVLDCSGLTFLDSSGIRAILGLAAKAPEFVLIRNPSRHVEKVLEIAGIDPAMGVRIETA